MKHIKSKKNVSFQEFSEQMDRFINSGFKRSRFTDDLYDFLHVHTNVFIAHFNKDWFYRARFETGAEETINALRNVRKIGPVRNFSLALADAMEKRLIEVETTVRHYSVCNQASKVVNHV